MEGGICQIMAMNRIVKRSDFSAVSPNEDQYSLSLSFDHVQQRLIAAQPLLTSGVQLT